MGIREDIDTVYKYTHNYNRPVIGRDIREKHRIGA